MQVWRWRNAPLPEPHLAGLGVGILAHIFSPWRLLSSLSVALVAGLPLVMAGAALALWAVAAAADVDLERPDRLVAAGPYRFSRNPMYVAWTFGYVGIALVANTAWPLALLPGVLAITHYWGIRREERALESRFGRDYRDYKARVRRYL